MKQWDYDYSIQESLEEIYKLRTVVDTMQQLTDNLKRLASVVEVQTGKHTRNIKEKLVEKNYILSPEKVDTIIDQFAGNDVGNNDSNWYVNVRRAIEMLLPYSKKHKNKLIKQPKTRKQGLLKNFKAIQKIKEGSIVK